MKARRCQGCGAALPESKTLDATRCPFCGLVHDSASSGSSATPIQVHVSTASLKRPIKWILAIVLLIVVASLIPVFGGLYLGWRAVSSGASNSGVSSSTALGLLKAKRLTPSDLRSASAGSHDLDAAAPAGGFAAVDAVSALPWALTIAQSWSPDARLERIDVTRMRPDGTVNVQDDPEAVIRYRFQSPQRIAALIEQARLSTSARAATGLFVNVERGSVRVLVNESTRASERDSVMPPNPTVLPLARLVAVPAVEKLITGVPFLSGYAIHLADEGWVWYFSTLAGESKPRVRGTDGAVWPYRRSH